MITRYYLNNTAQIPLLVYPVVQRFAFICFPEQHSCADEYDFTVIQSVQLDFTELMLFLGLHYDRMVHHDGFGLLVSGSPWTLSSNYAYFSFFGMWLHKQTVGSLPEDRKRNCMFECCSLFSQKTDLSFSLLNSNLKLD